MQHLEAAAEAASGFRIGIDVGGTFTDVVLRAPSGVESVCKVPSTPESPTSAVLAGMERALAEGGTAPGRLTFWASGTTMATNVLLERGGGRVGLLTTAGFGDLLEIGTQQRPSLYDLFADKPKVLVAAHLRREVGERLAADGSEVRSLDEKEVREALDELREQEVEALAVCFLHSYQCPDHEQATAEVVEAVWPEVYLSLSSEVLPEAREYERLSTTALNAYLGPVVDDYLEELMGELERSGLGCRPYVLQSNGRLMTFQAARRRPIRLVASGPSAGVTGAVAVGRLGGYDPLLTLDVGGTSADVGVIEGGEPRLTMVREVGGLPLKMPMVDVLSIGAGGGSIAWIDAGGFLRVGPQSAGAEPGPACYGRGGREPTVSDAHLVLGRLGPEGLLGGEMLLKQEAAEEALAGVGSQFGWTVVETAQGVIRLANAEMTRALHKVTAARGEDARAFTLLAYGGAGGLHAADLARALGIGRVVVPPAAGTFSARGVLASAPGMEFGRTHRATLEASRAAGISRAFADLKDEAQAWLGGEEVPWERQRVDWAMEARYLGQYHELTIPVADPLEDVGAVVEAFHAAHQQAYGFEMRDREVECITLRVYARDDEQREMGETDTAGDAGRLSGPDPISRRQVWWDEAGFVKTPVYGRNTLPVGWQAEGPAVIAQSDATTLVPPDGTVSVDQWRNLVIGVE